MHGLAIFSRNGKQRYYLRYRWGKGRRFLVFFMLNPSTADETGPDPTVTRAIGFAKREGYDGVIVVNAYPLVSTDPKGIKGELSPQAANYNHRCISAVAKRHSTVVVAWGGDCKSTPSEMLRLVRGYNFKRVYCLGMTKAGHPRHPLYLAGNTELQPWPSKPATTVSK